jgi:manganese/zinc/iron transport system permease protein
VSGWLGSSASALFDDLPAGAVIVLVAAGVFALSMLLGIRRGVVARWWRRRQLDATVGRQHLLRALYEALERQDGRDAMSAVPMRQLQASRSWSKRRLHRLIARAAHDGLASYGVDYEVRLTALGRREAVRVARNHRLWEMYLITHADIAPSHVDRDADMIEHVLDPEMVAKLERLVEKQAEDLRVPSSPHAI